MSDVDGPLEVMRVDAGRYVWEPVLQQVEYLAKGERSALRSFPLSESTNTYGGALRAAARDILKHTPAHAS